MALALVSHRPVPKVVTGCLGDYSTWGSWVLLMESKHSALTHGSGVDRPQLYPTPHLLAFPLPALEASVCSSEKWAGVA